MATNAIYANYWRTLIQAVRSIYSGTIVYAANWDDYNLVTFWDSVDLIGVDAYFPLLQGNSASIDNIKAAWQSCQVPGQFFTGQSYLGYNWLQNLRDFSVAKNKHIIFTEIGYQSLSATNVSQSVLAQPYASESGTVNLDIQSKAYSAFVEIFLKEAWFNGFFIWDWLTNPNAGGWNDTGYTPQNKPALEVLKGMKYYPQNIKSDILELLAKPGTIDYTKNDPLIFTLIAHQAGNVSIKIFTENYIKIVDLNESFNGEQTQNVAIDYNRIKNKISRGMYFYKISLNNFSLTGKFFILK